MTAGELFVASAWGQRARWFLNVMADPRVQVQVVGRLQYAGEVVALGESGAVRSHYSSALALQAFRHIPVLFHP